MNHYIKEFLIREYKRLYSLNKLCVVSDPRSRGLHWRSLEPPRPRPGHLRGAESSWTGSEAESPCWRRSRRLRRPRRLTVSPPPAPAWGEGSLLLTLSLTEAPGARLSRGPRLRWVVWAPRGRGCGGSGQQMALTAASVCLLECWRRTWGASRD